jgi:hypothetical protein
MSVELLAERWTRERAVRVEAGPVGAGVHHAMARVVAGQSSHRSL